MLSPRFVAGFCAVSKVPFPVAMYRFAFESPERPVAGIPDSAIAAIGS